MRFVASFISAIVFSLGAVAGGTEGVGGGDPMAVEFSDLARKLTRFATTNAGFSPPHYLKNLKRIERKWRWSLSHSKRKSLIAFVEERPLDGHGVPKAAVYYSETLEVRVHRPTWSAMSRQMRLELVAMELLGLADLDYDRYEIACQMVRDHADDILGY